MESKRETLTKEAGEENKQIQKKVKLNFFAKHNASCVADEIMARRILSSTFPYYKLEHPILYRGDTRSPDDIFEKGFYRKIQVNKIVMPEISEKRESIDCIACSANLCYAVGFADCPDDSLGKEKEKESWVYMVYVNEAIQLSDDKLYAKCEDNRATLVNEHTVTGIPPEHVMAAFKIETGKYNKIENYYTYPTYREAQDVKWKLAVLDFKINEKCIVKENNPNLFQAMVEEFLKPYQEGYFENPLNPLRDKDEFPITDDMTPLQKQIYAWGYKMTLEQLKKITYPEQMEAMKFGFSVQDVTSEWFSKEHLNAFKKWIPVKDLVGRSEVEAYALSKKLKLPEIKDLTTKAEVDEHLSKKSNLRRR